LTMSNKRELLIRTAGELIERQGYHASALSEILETSQAPKGSLYYYFPEGKEQLAEEAVLHIGQELAARVRMGLTQHADPTAAFAGLLEAIARQVERSGYRAGGPLTAIAMETATSNPRLNLACRQAFESIHQEFTAKLAEAGISNSRSEELSSLILAIIEGATLLSRTMHSGDPLRNAGRQIAALLADVPVS
jgi:TetR/AcrR family transcriptional regulator, lmrAB and yxaGH operons repressor